MIEFNWFEGWVRKHFRVYLVLRWLAPLICKFVDLEDGFSILKRLSVRNDKLVAVDIGSNDGTSMRMIKRYMPKASIIAIDPIRKPAVTITGSEYLKVALGKSFGTRLIYVPIVKGHRITQYSSFDATDLLSSVVHDTKIAISDITLSTENVNVITLDSLKVEPFFLKIDVEGAELDVLEGSIETIRGFKPVVLVEIQNQYRYKAIWNFFNQLGYINVGTDLSKTSKTAFSLNYAFTPKFRNYIWLPRNYEELWIK
jgi:FkbM family methyltransferase